MPLVDLIIFFQKIVRHLQCYANKTVVLNALVNHDIDGLFSAIEQSGWPKATTYADDHIIRRIAVRSPRSSCEKLKAALRGRKKCNTWWSYLGYTASNFDWLSL